MQIDQNYFLENGLAIDIIPTFLQNSSTYFAVLTDMNGNYIYANDYFIEVFSELYEDFIGVNALETIHFDDHQICIDTMQNLFQNPQSTIQVILRKSITKEDYYYTSWEFSLLYNKINQAVGIYCIGHNISKRIKAEMKVEEIESRLSSMVNSSSDGMLLISPENKVLARNNKINEFFLQFLNKSINIGDDVFDYFLASYDEQFRIHFNQAINGETIRVDVEVKKLDNSNVWFHFKYYPAYTQSKQLLGVVLTVVDIDTRKRLELEIQRKEERTRLALSILKYGICELDVNTGIKFLDSEYKKILEFDDDIESESLEEWKIRIHQNDKEEVLSLFNNFINGKCNNYQIDYQQYTKKNNLLWIRSKAEIVEYDESGKAKRILGLITDVTNEKQKQDKLQTLSKAIEYSPTISVVTDKYGIINYVNPKFTEVTGYNYNEALGKNPNILKSGYQDLSFYKEMWEELIKNKVWRGEFVNKKKNGELYLVSSAIAAILNDNNEVTHYIALSEDITQKRELENNLKIAMNKALESEKLKNAFLSNLSHEIRTPLNGILGFVEILKSFDISDLEREEFAEILKKSGNRLLNMMDDLVSISKIHAGQLEINNSKFNVRNLIYDVSEKYHPYIDETKLELIHCIESQYFDYELYSDKQIITQILLHIYANAVKFTQEGYIEIGFNVQENEILFFVKDTGIGIANDKKNIIFEKFRQIDEHLNRSYEGIGLGLSICKGFIDMLNGKIWLESEENKGTAFYFIIPIDNN